MQRLARLTPCLIHEHALWKRCFASPAANLPIIDISSLTTTDVDCTSPQVVKIGKQLDDAIRTHGFFYITNHGIDTHLSTRVIEEARAWFNLPLHVKQQIALQGQKTNFRGYQALGTNVTRYDIPNTNTNDGSGSYSNQPTTTGYSRDHHEAIDLYKEIPQPNPAITPSPIHGVNPWPTQLPSFNTTLQDYITACTVLGKNLMRGIAVGLNLPFDTFEGERAGDSYWVTRVIHYPPLPVVNNNNNTLSAIAVQQQQPASLLEKASQGAHIDRSVQLSCGEHTDYGLLTFVNQELGVPGLQVQDVTGNWTTAEPIPGTLVCNIGDMFKVWTNGRYTPTLHRVVNLAKDGRSRTSVAFFYEPNFDAVIAPLVELCEPLPPAKFNAVRYGAHLESKVLRNFELEEEGEGAAAV